MFGVVSSMPLERLDRISRQKVGANQTTIGNTDKSMHCRTGSRAHILVLMSSLIVVLNDAIVIFGGPSHSLSQMHNEECARFSCGAICRLVVLTLLRRGLASRCGTVIRCEYCWIAGSGFGERNEVWRLSDPSQPWTKLTAAPFTRSRMQSSVITSSMGTAAMLILGGQDWDWNLPIHVFDGQKWIELPSGIALDSLWYGRLWSWPQRSELILIGGLECIYKVSDGESPKCTTTNTVRVAKTDAIMTVIQKPACQQSVPVDPPTTNPQGDPIGVLLQTSFDYAKFEANSNRLEQEFQDNLAVSDIPPNRVARLEFTTSDGSASPTLNIQFLLLRTTSDRDSSTSDLVDRLKAAINDPTSSFMQGAITSKIISIQSQPAYKCDNGQWSVESTCTEDDSSAPSGSGSSDVRRLPVWAIATIVVGSVLLLIVCLLVWRYHGSSTMTGSVASITPSEPGSSTLPTISIVPGGIEGAIRPPSSSDSPEHSTTYQAMGEGVPPVVVTVHLGVDA